MPSARHFLSLTPSARWRLLFAFLIVASIRIGLAVMSFPRFDALLARRSGPARAKRVVTIPAAEQLAYDVRVTSGLVPRATCLVQALAGKALLEHYGYEAIVHVGVTKRDRNGTAFQAHAWLESGGKVVLGESEVAYVPLTTLANDSARVHAR